MNSISVIIPINEMTSKLEEYFGKALKSIETQKVSPEKVYVVHTPEVKNFLTDYDFGELEVNLIENEGDSQFTGQINKAVEEIDTDWFTVLEVDDEFSNIWLDNFKKYAEAYEDVVCFLPIVVDTNEKGEFLNFTNEAVWAMNFSDKMGYLDNGCLLKYQNFQSSGMAFKKVDFEDIGGFKPSMKLTFVYEFLLRATYNDKRIMTIPKVGYKHTNMREGSLFWNYRNNEEEVIVPDEAKFWIDTAKKEYFFTSDRGIKYEPNAE
tara:strand:- start:6574 stop:7365 length:792 start_codon:yes stop_codon:yes gene_type:complete